MSSLTIGLFIVGDEILTGRRVDQHMQQVIQLLGTRGLQLSWVQYIADRLEIQVDAYQRSARQGAVVFSCGGIGATPDDHTRQAAAIAFQRPLVRHPQAEQLIQERIYEMAKMGKAPQELDHPENLFRLRMADLPENAELIHNPVNRFPGFSVEQHHFVPGFPAMAWPMIAEVLDTRYTAYFHQQDHIEQSVIIYRLSESQIIALMEKIEREHPLIGTFSLPFLGNDTERPHIEFGIKGPEKEVLSLWTATLDALKALGAEIKP